jgi:hypothetical protein
MRAPGRLGARHPRRLEAILFGDPAKGSYRAFTKFEPGVANPLHTHPNDLWMVVLDGTDVYKLENGAEQRVGAGSYFFIPRRALRSTEAPSSLPSCPPCASTVDPRLTESWPARRS